MASNYIKDQTKQQVFKEGLMLCHVLPWEVAWWASGWGLKVKDEKPCGAPLISGDVYINFMYTQPLMSVWVNYQPVHVMLITVQFLFFSFPEMNEWM